MENIEGVLLVGDVSFRNWEIWINTSFINGNNETISGYYECILLPLLMVQQTAEFLAEDYQVSLNTVTKTSHCAPEIIKMMTTSHEGNLCLKIRDNFHTGKSIDTYIRDILNLLETLSICVDTALVCNSIRFTSDNYGRTYIFR